MLRTTVATLILLLISPVLCAQERTWEDSTGKHKVVGSLVEVTDSSVLLRINGDTKLIPLDKLSEADQAYATAERKSQEKAEAESSKSTITGSESQLKLVAWNVESGGNSPDVIAEQIKYFADYDVIGLNEVNSKNVGKYAQALGPQFQSFVSETGRADRLAILFDKNRFELLEQVETAQYRE